MPRPITISLTPVAVDADGIATSQAPLAQGNLTLDGALGTSLTHASQLGITSDADDSGRTFTVTGTDTSGQTITESVTGPNATTVETSNYFKTITSIAIDAASAGNLTVGTVDEIVSQTIPLNRYSDIETGVLVTVSGTINYTLEVSGTDPQLNADTSMNWHDHTTMASETTNITDNIDKGVQACRIKVNSYSSGATLTCEIIESCY